MSDLRVVIDPAVSGLRAEDLPRLPGVTERLLHGPDSEYGFLHDNALGWHAGTLFAAWYNCPVREIVGSSTIRGRRSSDGGATWSPVETIAEDSNRLGVYYVPVVFHSSVDGHCAFVAYMVGHDQVTHCEAFLLGRDDDRWRSVGTVARHFLPNCAPVALGDGTWLIAGRASDSHLRKPAYPAVAIAELKHPSDPWTVIRLSPDELPLHPETTVWVNGRRVTALVRGGPDGGARLFESDDRGRTWIGPEESNLPAADSKLYAGRLSSGQRYLIWNWPPERDTLVIGVSRPGEELLTSAWVIQHGPSERLGVQPEWSYPCALECHATLHVIYTSEKRHSVLTSIPVSLLASATRAPIGDSEATITAERTVCAAPSTYPTRSTTRSATPRRT